MHDGSDSRVVFSKFCGIDELSFMLEPMVDPPCAVVVMISAWRGSEMLHALILKNLRRKSPAHLMTLAVISNELVMDARPLTILRIFAEKCVVSSPKVDA